MSSIEEALESLFEKSPLPQALLKIDGSYILANRKERVQRRMNQTVSSYNLFNFIPPTQVKCFRNVVANSIKTQSASEFEYFHAGHHHKIQISPQGNSQFTILEQNSSCCDFVSSKLVRLIEDVDRLECALIAANIGCWDYHPQEKRIIANKTWVEQKRYQDVQIRANHGTFSEVVNGLDKWRELVHPEDLENTLSLIEQHLRGDTEQYSAKFRIKCGDEKWRWIHDIGRVNEWDVDGNPVRMNGVHIDITKEKSLEEKVNELLNIDELTGVRNRRSFTADVARIREVSKREGDVLCFMLLDIDNFKHFNDSYGHIKGDRALELIGSEMRKHARRKNELCFRLGGEEFAIVFQSTSVTQGRQHALLIKSVIEALHIPHEQSLAESQYVTVSIGLVCDTGNHLSTDDLYHKADCHLYEAKNSGRNQLRFESI